LRAVLFLIHEIFQMFAVSPGYLHRKLCISVSREGFMMATDNHYFIEQTEDGYAVRAKGSDRASAILPTQAEAIARAEELNPNDHPDVSRVRNTEGGGPDKWRKA
jgi:hypothetical protein